MPSARRSLQIITKENRWREAREEVTTGLSEETGLRVRDPARPKRLERAEWE